MSAPLRSLHLFAGAGGGILADLILGHVPVAAVEIEPYCQEVLRARQRDKWLPEFPIFGDIREFDGNPWRGRVDIVAGGFPCQDISVAGAGAGISGARSGLWAEFARVIGEIRPRYAFIENSPALTNRGLDRVLADLAALGMDARWAVLGADDVGAPHIRKRIWILADSGSARAGGHGGQTGDAHGGARGVGLSTLRSTDGPTGSNWTNSASAGAANVAESDGFGCQPSDGRGALRNDQRDGAGVVRQPLQPAGAGGTGAMASYVADAAGIRQQTTGDRTVYREAAGAGQANLARGGGKNDGPQFAPATGGGRRQPEPRMGRVTHGLAGWLDRPNPWGDGWEDGTPRIARGVPKRVHRIRAIGNGQVPQAAAQAWRILVGEVSE